MSTQHNMLNTFQPEKVGGSASVNPSSVNSEYLLANALQAQQVENASAFSPQNPSYENTQGTSTLFEQARTLASAPAEGLRSMGIEPGTRVLFDGSQLSQQKREAQTLADLAQIREQYSAGQQGSVKEGTSPKVSSVTKADQAYEANQLQAVRRNLQEITQLSRQDKTGASGRSRIASPVNETVQGNPEPSLTAITLIRVVKKSIQRAIQLSKSTASWNQESSARQKKRQAVMVGINGGEQRMDAVAAMTHEIAVKAPHELTTSE